MGRLCNGIKLFGSSENSSTMEDSNITLHFSLGNYFFSFFFFRRFDSVEIKSAAKAKLADDHNIGSIRKPLTRLEEKIISIYGMDCMDGCQSLGETGFRYRKVRGFLFVQFDATPMKVNALTTYVFVS